MARKHFLYTAVPLFCELCYIYSHWASLNFTDYIDNVYTAVLVCFHI